MTFSPKLEERFAKLVTRYPEGRKRAALIPMLMYAQDEVGWCNEELKAEVAHRLGISVMEVTEVIGYYSMLRKKPMGKTHVQICTNISCLLWDGDKLWEQACKKLGIGHNETTADGKISLEDVECDGACSWAPSVRLNYDYLHNVTPAQLDQVIDDLRKA
jgi:NADH-quinone oxidoreductase subunit E